MMGIALIMLMAGFIKICSVHTPSSNPKLPPPKPLPGIVQHICLYSFTLSIYSSVQLRFYMWVHFVVKYYGYDGFEIMNNVFERTCSIYTR